MANRYNQYQHINYVGLPLDAYQMAAGAVEQENISQMQAAKSVYDGMQEIEAVYNPDIALKGELLEGVKKQIGEMAGKNLKGTDVLMNLSKIVNNRDTIGKLADIYANTVNYKSALAAEKKYVEDNGNDINIQQGVDQRNAYNQLDSKGFKPGMMAGYTPGKFVDVVGDMQKVLEKAKADGWERNEINGKWINKQTGKELSMEKLLGQAGMLMNDPKYATQLQKLAYYGLRNYGVANDPKMAIGKYNQLHATALSDQITNIASQLTDLQKKQKDAGPKAGLRYSKAIEKATQAMSKLAAQRDAYQTDQTGSLYNHDLFNTLAESAAAPFYYKEYGDNITVNPYGLAQVKSDLTFGRWKRAHDLKNAEDDKKAEFLEKQNRPVPTMQSVKIPTVDNKVGVQTTAIQFTKQGGFDVSAMAETIAGALNKGDGVMDISSVKSPKDFESLKKSETLKQGLASGKYQAFYIPGTKQYMITSGKSRFLVNADQGMQTAMDPLFRLYDPNMKEGVTEVPGVAVNGEDATTVIAVKTKDNPDPALYSVYSGTPFNLETVNDSDWRKAIGMDLGKSAMYSEKTVYPGVYVAFDGAIKEPSGNSSSVRRVFTEDEYNALRKENLIDGPFKAVHIYKKNNDIQLVEPEQGGEAGYRIARNHTIYQTRLGGELRNIRDKKLNEKEKNTTVQLDDEIPTDLGDDNEN